MRIPVLSGRSFTTDDTPSTPNVIVISHTMASRLWGAKNPVGDRIRFDVDSPWYTVVGVVGDVYQFEIAPDRGALAVYYPLSQLRGFGGQQTIVVRTHDDPRPMMTAIKQQIWTVDADQPILNLTTIEDRYVEFFAAPRFNAVLMIAFAAIGLLTAAVGLYGVLAYAVASRTREIGVRIALGAERRDIVTMVLRSGAAMIGVGLAIGALASLAATRALDAMLIGVARLDVTTYIAVAGVLAVTSLVACWVPARRATRVDPIVALRAE
jgi:predicted permease